jgi:hypothetical protein
MRFQVNNIKTKSSYLLTTIAAVATMANSHVHAQALEPRAYANAPVGLNFLLLGYQHSSGSLLFDPAVPITDADVSIDMELLAYVRTLDIAGHSAKAGAVVPYASLDGNGYVNGDYRTRQVDGFADPTFSFTINLSGAPALTPEQFRSYQQDTIIGFTFKLTAPLGEYQADKLINIGTNRWSFEPEFGISQALGKWTVEASTAAIFYTDNDEFGGDKTRQQDPIYSAQFHVIYSFPKNIWLAVSSTYYTGGRTTIDGVLNSDLQQNWRTGVTLALPINRNHSLKLYGSNGVSTRTGTDYEILGIAWQYRWGNGF